GDRGRPGLVFLQDAHRGFELLVFLARDDAPGHHIARGHGRAVDALSDATANDIPVRDHADEPIVFAHRHRSDILIPHQPGKFCYRGARLYPVYSWMHDVLDFHLSLSSRPEWNCGWANSLSQQVGNA